MQLIEAESTPADSSEAGDTRRLTALVEPAALVEIATYASAIGPEKSLVIPRNPSEELAEPTSLVADAHAAGLLVLPWTFRAENVFLPAQFRSGDRAAEHGDLGGELACFLSAAIDGFFTDQPDIGVRARNAFVGSLNC